MSAGPNPAPSRVATAPPFDLARIRSDFPILDLTVNGKPLAYLDNAASAQMPKPVIDRAKAILPQLQAHLAEGLDMPELAERARQAAQQMQLFADPATRIARELKHADLDNMTPIQAMDLLRKLKAEI